jgi:hypothetical protein
MPSPVSKYNAKLPGFNPTPEVVLADPPVPSQHEGKTWTDYEVALLIYGLKKRWSYGVIARKLLPKKSRNALIGKSQRLRLAAPGNVGERESVGGWKKKVSPRRAEYRRSADDGVDMRVASNKRKKDVTLPSLGGAIEKLPRKSAKATRVPNPLGAKARSFSFEDRLKPPEKIDDSKKPALDKEPRITELMPDQCRWPIGRGSDGQHRFCRNVTGAVKDRRGNMHPMSWCVEHIHVGCNVQHGATGRPGRFPLPNRNVDTNQDDP